MTMTKPSQDADRLQTVQRVARYVLSRSTVGQTRFAAMEVFPPDLTAVKSGTPEYAWRQQLAWTWAKAGFLHEALAGTGLQKCRIYTMLQAGRDGLERIAADPVLASFYISNKRTGGDIANRPAEFFRPPELVRVATVTERSRRIVSPSFGDEDTPGKGLRLVPPSAESAPEENEAAREEQKPSDGSLEGVQEMISELRGLPIFFERITSVLERMNERLVKVENMAQSAADDQAAIRDELTNELVPDKKDMPATRDEVATALAEMTQSFLRDNPQNAVVTASLSALATKISQHEQFHVMLAKEVGVLASAVKKSAENPARMETFADDVSKILRSIVTEEVARAFIKDLPKIVHTVMSDEISPGLALALEAMVRMEGKFEAHAKTSNKHVERVIGEKVGAATENLGTRIGATHSSIDAAVEKFEKTAAMIDQRQTAHGAVVSKIIEQRFEALASNIESRLDKRLSAIAPDANAVRKLSEKLESEISATCETLKEDLASISADAQDLAERVESVVESFNVGHAEFKRQGEVVVENFKSVSDAAEMVLEGAQTVAKEMIILARLRALKEGATLEETFTASDAAIARVAEAETKMINKVSALGGGLIRPHGAPLRPIIVQTKETKEDES